MSTIGSASTTAGATVRASLTGGRRDVAGIVFQVMLLASLLFSLAVLLVLVVDVSSLIERYAASGRGPLRKTA